MFTVTVSFYELNLCMENHIIHHRVNVRWDVTTYKVWMKAHTYQGSVPHCYVIYKCEKYMCLHMRSVGHVRLIMITYVIG